MKTVAVIEGFSGGPLKTRLFKKALAAAGFKVVKDKRTADIIIAHSAGIYAVPLNSVAKLLMLIGPTYWPGERLLIRMLRHARASRKYIVSNFGWRNYIWKKATEFYYIFRRPKLVFLGLAHNNKLDRLEKLIDRPGLKVIIIRNHEDAFSSNGLKDVIKRKNVQFVELPGIHDDYYTNPKPYIDLLLKELK